MTRHCHRCGRDWTASWAPGRNDACLGCGADLRVCLNCVQYDRAAAEQCRERRADLVIDKDRANYCEYFDFRRGVFAPGDPGLTREDAARTALRKLFGD